MGLSREGAEIADRQRAARSLIEIRMHRNNKIININNASTGSRQFSHHNYSSLLRTSTTPPSPPPRSPTEDSLPSSSRFCARREKRSLAGSKGALHLAGSRGREMAGAG